MSADYDSRTKARKVEGFPTISVPVAVTTSAGAYTAGDGIGGIMTVPGLLLPRGSGLLQSILVVDRANQKPNLTLVFFNAAPAGTYTDNLAVPVMAAADSQKVVAKVNILTADFETINTIGIAHITNIGKVLKMSDLSVDLRLLVLTTGTPTYGANSTDLSFLFGAVPD